MGYTLSLILASLPVSDCPAISKILPEIREDILIGDLDDVPQRIDSAKESLHCSHLQPHEIGELWLLQGVYAHLQEEPKSVELFAAAGRLKSWDSGFGDDIHKLYLAAQRSTYHQGTIKIKHHKHYTTFLNGRRIKEEEIKLIEGLYTIQVLDEKSQIFHSRWIKITPNEMLYVHPEFPKNKKWLYTGLLLASGAMVFAGAAKYNDRVMEESTTVNELNRAYTQQNFFAFTTISLSLASIGGFGIYWFRQ